MTGALTDLRTVVAGGVVAAVVVAAAFAISPLVLVDDGAGSSMRPTLCDGSVVVLDESASVDVGDIVAYDRGAARVGLHRAVAVTDEHVVTMGDNRDEPDLLTPDRDETADVVTRGARLGYPDREDVLGVVVLVVDDGCGGTAS
jgi:ABC-type arginine transport system ATPase subunit